MSCPRILKALCINFPSKVNDSSSSTVIRNMKVLCLFMFFNSGYICAVFSNSSFLSSLYREHSTRRCSSSSKTLQTWHTLNSIGVLGRVYRPRSISRMWELVRNFDIDALYFGFLTFTRYGSVLNCDLNWEYVLRIGNREILVKLLDQVLINEF